MPQSFPLLPRYEHHGIRCPFRDCVISYRVENDRISIVHILHGARDHEALLFRSRDASNPLSTTYILLARIR